MCEIWKDIENYEGSYQVSNFGNVRSLDRIVTNIHGRKQIRKGKLLKQVRTGSRRNYLSVRLSAKNYKVHRLVAQSFIDNSENKSEVNHIDENTFNNHVDNLEWVTAKENSNHGTRNKRIHEHDLSYNRKPIICSNGVKYESAREAARELGLSSSQICLVLNDKREQTKGHSFKYL